jgi:hypothetical protein
MPRKSHSRLALEAQCSRWEAKVLDPATPEYCRTRYESMLANQRRQFEREAREKKASAAVRAAARAEENRTYPTLPPRETAQEYEERVKRQLGH